MSLLGLGQFATMLRAAWKFRAYEPQPVTLPRLAAWVRQFPEEYRGDLLRLVADIRYVSKKETIRSLVELNQRVLTALKADGVDVENVIYIETDSAGSSSGVMLNLLRDHAKLQRSGATFLHSTNVTGIQETSMRIGTGAIVYVDDFAATGKQIVRSRKRVAQYVAGSFSEFFLLPCICEEAIGRLEPWGVVHEASFVHRRAERPLLPECDALPAERSEQLVNFSIETWGERRVSLGFDGLATNVVFYRNAPNSTPLLFRGHLGQKPLYGIVPRFDDLGP